MRNGCVVMGALLSVTAAWAKPPSKSDVAKLLKQTIKEVRSVSEVFADLGGGRHPVLFVTRGNDCIERVIDKQKEQNCSATSIPHVAIVKAGEAGLALESELALPVSAAPWDQPEALKWGITQIKDWDGDGQPELLIIYGYHGPTVWAIGDTYYRELALFNLAPLAPAVHVTLDQKPQDSASLDLESKFKFAGGELTITRHAGEYDDAKSERVYKDSQQLWRRGADDKYAEAKK